VWCPKCASSDKNKRKLVILVLDDRYKCWVCGSSGRSIATIIRKYYPQYFNEYVEKFAGKNKKNLIVDEVQREDKVELPEGFKLLALSTSKDPDIAAVKRYLMNRRRIDEEDMWRFKFGCVERGAMFRRAIMPSFNAEGELNYVTARTIDKKQYGKYKNPPIPKNTIVFNEINVDWKKRLVLCEGPFDLVKCGDNAVPLLGSDINEEYELFSQIIVNNTPVAIALDKDMWSTKTPKIVKKFVEYNVDTIVVDTREIEDPGAVTKREFKQLLSEAKPLVWEDSLRSKLERVSVVSTGV